MTVGTGICMATLLPDGTKSAEEHQEALSQPPVACFAVCITMKNDTEEHRRRVNAYPDPAGEMVEPVDMDLFARMIDYGALSFAARMMSRAMKVSEGDFGDWNAIRAWAGRVHS